MLFLAWLTSNLENPSGPIAVSTSSSCLSIGCFVKVPGGNGSKFAKPEYS